MSKRKKNERTHPCSIIIEEFMGKLSFYNPFSVNIPFKNIFYNPFFRKHSL